jgi:hypothetical protein
VSPGPEIFVDDFADEVGAFGGHYRGSLPRAGSLSDRSPRNVRGMRLLASALTIAALGVSCSHPPPPKRAAPELAITGIASVAGRWVADGNIDWGYALSIAADGAFVLAIDRDKLGRCEQKGTLVSGADPKTYQLTDVHDSCNRDAAGGPVEVRIASFTGEALELVVVADRLEERRRYQRDPKTAP